jgi:hypothetical protein
LGPIVIWHYFRRVSPSSLSTSIVDDSDRGLSLAREGTSALLNTLFLQALFYVIGRRLRIRTSELTPQSRLGRHFPLFHSNKAWDLIASDPVDPVEMMTLVGTVSMFIVQPLRAIQDSGKLRNASTSFIERLVQIISF